MVPFIPDTTHSAHTRLPLVAQSSECADDLRSDLHREIALDRPLCFRGMSDAFLTALMPVIVALVTVVGQRLSGRNDRAQTHQEVDLLAKLDARSRAASNLNQVIEDRIEDWHRRAHRRRGSPLEQERVW